MSLDVGMFVLGSHRVRLEVLIFVSRSHGGRLNRGNNCGKETMGDAWI